MKIQVEPKVKAGTVNGGEDLFLSFTVFHDGEAPPVDEDLEVGLAVADDYEVSAEVTSGEYDPENCERFWPKAKVKYQTYHSEFEWEGTGTDFLAEKVCRNDQTVEQYLRSHDNWVFCHKPGESPRLTCTGSVFCDGNAD